MTSTAEIAKPERKAAGKPPPRLLTVESAWRLTPNMIRVVFAGPELDGFPTGRDGGNCKLMLPNVGESRSDVAERFLNGPPPVRRTYT
ncbi:MAG: siderophore-interacting protein, partial [Pseudomonadota bacterium]